MPSLTVELHGGEPLLLGKQRMQSLLTTLLSNSKPIHLRITLQTNGTLLDREWLEIFGHYGISFGISLDGPPSIADKRRVYRDGAGGATQRILDIIQDLRSSTPLFEELFGGCLCVVNPDLNGGELVDWFVQQGLSAFDFLLPDGNRRNLPQSWTGVQPYARFLLAAFDRWYSLADKAPRIRKFELMLMGLMGAEVPLDALGGDLRRLCVVESDGSIGVSDVARICGGDFSRDILNIFEHLLDEHVLRYGILDIQRVCATCEACPHLASCGGGYLPHRFDGTTFQNPSLYCEALYALSARMAEVLRADLPPQVWTTQADLKVATRCIDDNMGSAI